jgi:hypothetical protein
MTSDLSDKGRAALDYARAGMRVFPLAPRRKVPLISKHDGGNGFHDATTDEAQINEWWGKHPDANIGGAIPEGEVVIDVDPRNNGPATLGELERRHGELPSTRTGFSGRGDGGSHRWYRVKVNGKVVPTSLGPGVDVLHGSKKYVALPPSIHPDSGQPYTWDQWPDTVADLPDWVYESPDKQLVREHDPIYDDPELRDPDSPGHDFNQRGDITPYMIKAGWQVLKTIRNGDVYWVRPGKRLHEGHAAIWHPETRHLVVWSSETVFSLDGKEQAGFSPWRVFAYLRHRAADKSVDFTAAAAELRGRGYGKQESEEPADETSLRRSPTLVDLLMRHDEEEYDWLIEGLLERGDRLVLTGKEGEGKSTLLRQIGIAAAAGLHPFTQDATPELRVLDIDCENSERQLRREFRKALQPLADDVGLTDIMSRFFYEAHTEGLVLDDARDRDGDRAWLEATIKADEPQLVILGPIYKLIGGDSTDEEPNRELVKFLDRLRTRYGFAIMLEGHTPHDAKRPYGWSGWKRWPEFGLHLDEHGELSRWRGDRDARDWPERLVRGADGDWLWKTGGPTTWEPRPDPQESKIADAGLAILRVMRDAESPLSRPEVLERAGRQRQSAIAAFTRLRDRRAFLVTNEDRVDVMNRTRQIEVFVINPKGPYVAD